MNFSIRNWKVNNFEVKLLRNIYKPSAATEHALSRQTAQISLSSEDVVMGLNPHSLQEFKGHRSLQIHML